MKVALVTGMAFICAGLLAAEEPKGGEDHQTAVLQSTAAELDHLVSQNKSVEVEIVKPGFKPVRKSAEPVSLQRIAPVVAKRLKMNERQVADLLTGDQEKLSDLVFARLLEQTSGKSWKHLLTQHESADLIRMAKEQRITAKAKKVLDELYTELSFVALDAMEKDQAKGSAPGKSGENGSDSTSRKD
jgi:hypothetical protein